MKLLNLKITVVIVCLAFAANAQPKSNGGKTSLGTPDISNYFEPSSGDDVKPADDGFIKRWLLLEPISKPNRTNAVFTDSYLREVFGKEYFPNQLSVLPKNGDKVKVLAEMHPPADMRAGRPTMPTPEQKPIFKNQTLQWHAFDSKLYNVKLYRFATGLNKQHYGVIFWAVTVINCDADIENVRLSAGSNSASMWWLNGEEVLLMSGDRRIVADDCASPLTTLKKGKNILRVAVINGPGMSDFCARFVDIDGKPINNFSISNK